MAMLLREDRVGPLRSLRGARRLLALAAAATVLVSLISSPATAVTLSKIANVASLTRLVTNCNGQLLTSLIPPAGFGLPFSELQGISDASPGVLRVESSDLQWVPATCASDTNSPTSTPEIAPSPDNIPASGEIPSHAWSGFDTDSSGGTYHAVEMEWLVPSVPSARVKRVSNTWAGFGGCAGNGDLLVQAGTESDQNADGTVHYYPWWEACPINNIQPITSFAVAPRDDMFVYIDHSGYGQAEILLIDYTKNKSIDFYTTWGPAYTIGRQADWILERPSVGGVHPYLAPINSGTYITLMDMYAIADGSSSLTPLGDLRRFFFYMYNCSNTTRMAHTGGISADGTAVPVYFDSSGDNNQC
jgi:hypothetical protein